MSALVNCAHGFPTMNDAGPLGRQDSRSDGRAARADSRKVSARIEKGEPMSFFRDYLRANNVMHDPRFDETDEDFLVQALLQARMHRSKTHIVIKAGFFGKRDLERELKTPKGKEALQFVAAFLCYMVPTPITYQKEMEGFKMYFTPGFANDSSKHEQLARGLRDGFFDATLESLETTETLDALFDIAELNVAQAQG